MDSDVPAASSPAPFDLEAYIGRYPVGSENRLQRLLFIAAKTQDQDLAKQALQLAEQHMRETSNTRAYTQVFGDGSNVTDDIGAAGDGDGGTGGFDVNWVRETEMNSQVSMEILEGRLSAAQAHLQKEAIRTAHLAIGEFCKQRGDLQQALRAVMRSRDFCTSRSQTAHVCLLIIELSMDTKNYKQVHDYVSKAEHSTIPGDLSLPLKLKVASGTAHLAQGNFQAAAEKLTSIPMGCDDTIISPEDIALYGSLCALATFDREELMRLLEVQGILELAPQMRDGIQRYCRADYPGCLSVLKQIYPHLQLDMIISEHLEMLMEIILHKCCIEYLRPYRKVNLQQMASIFSTDLDKLISMLATLIGNDRIPNARIDCLTQTLERLDEVAILHRRQHATRKKLLGMEQNILNDAYAMMVRVACSENATSRKGGIFAMEVMESDDDDHDEPMELEVGNPEDVY